MSAQRLPDEEHHEGPREHARDDLLGLVHKRLSQGTRIVRLSGRTRRAVGESEPVVAPATGANSTRD